MFFISGYLKDRTDMSGKYNCKAGLSLNNIFHVIILDMYKLYVLLL